MSGMGEAPRRPKGAEPAPLAVPACGSEAAAGASPRGGCTALRVGRECGAKPPPATEWPACREAEPPGRAERSSAHGALPGCRFCTLLR